MKTDKIKFWTRVGELAFLLFQLFTAVHSMQYEPFVSAGTNAQILALIAFGFYLLFLEAIIQLIRYFAELLEEKK